MEKVRKSDAEWREQLTPEQKKALVGALADPQRSTAETAAALRTALGDRAEEVGRLLVA